VSSRAKTGEVLTVLMFLVVLQCLVAATARARCPNEELRAQDVYALKLPDCRAYEQVSPVDKNESDAVGAPGQVQSSPSGEEVTFFSLLPFPGAPGAAEFPTYLSTRESGTWATEALLPPTSPGSTVTVAGMTEDLSEAIIEDNPSNPPLTSEATSGHDNYYLRDSATGSFRLLTPDLGNSEDSFDDATLDDATILFESQEKLTPNAQPGVINLYEWDDGQVSLAGELPDHSAPEKGSVAGAGGPSLKAIRESTARFYAQNTISTNGSRVFFSDLGTGQIYVHERGAATIQVAAAQGAPPVEEYWRGSTPDGLYGFFTSEAKLTPSATASPEHPDLYRFDVETKELIDLTTEAPEGAGVLGVVGISDDGAYVYFVAEGVLAEGAKAEKANLYEWHKATGGTTSVTFIASLQKEEDAIDWLAYSLIGGEPGGVAGGGKGSRVTPDGKTLLFSSVKPVTGYENSEQHELYLYSAERPVSASNPVCVSCNPSGAPAKTEAYLSHTTGSPSPANRNAFMTRNLSDDGDRVFFETEEILVPQDTNGQMNVYEWEREGISECMGSSENYYASSGGCLYLISSGTSSSESYFGDADAEGDNVFFFTRQSLVGQDRDSNVDLYDARVDGGIATQNPLPSAMPCVSVEECQEALVVPSAMGPPLSVTFSAERDIASGSSVPTKEPTVKRPKKIKKRKRRAKKRKAHGRKAGKSNHYRVGGIRRGAGS
jgi:hypothetical protein